MNQKIYYLFIILFMVVAVFGWAGGDNETADGASAASNSLVIAISEEITGTDMQQVFWSNIVHKILYDPIVSFSLDNSEILPDACESYEIRDGGKIIAFTFSDNAKFGNGTQMTAESVKKSIERYIEISPYASDFAPVQKMVVENGNTLLMEFEKPTAYIWAVLASTYAGVVDVDAANEMGIEKFNRNSITYGPLRVKDWVQGSHITLEKNAEYKSNNPMIDNEGPLHVDEVKVRFIPDSFTRISELLSGDVDLLIDVPIESVKALQSNNEVNLYTAKQAGMDFLYLNTKAEMLQDINVRKAISLAINKDELQTALKDTVNAAYGFISPAQIAFSAEAENQLKSQFGFDLAKAKQLLAQAGWKDDNDDGIVEKNGKDLEITMLVSLDIPLLKQSAPIIQNQLKQAGIKLNLREFESKYVKQRVRDGEYEIADRHYEWLDPDMLTYLFHTDSGIYSDPKVDKLIEEGRFIMDLDERAKKYGEAQLALMENVPAVSLFYQNRYAASKKNIKGLKVSVNEVYFIQDLIKE